MYARNNKIQPRPSLSRPSLSLAGGLQRKYRPPTLTLKSEESNPPPSGQLGQKRRHDGMKKIMARAGMPLGHSKVQSGGVLSSPPRPNKMAKVAHSRLATSFGCSSSGEGSSLGGGGSLLGGGGSLLGGDGSLLRGGRLGLGLGLGHDEENMLYGNSPNRRGKWINMLTFVCYLLSVYIMYTHYFYNVMFCYYLYRWIICCITRQGRNRRTTTTSHTFTFTYCSIIYASCVVHRSIHQCRSSTTTT